MRIAGRARPVMWSSVGKLWIGRGQRVLCCPSPIHGLSTRSWRPYRQDVHMKGCVRSVLPLQAVLRGFLANISDQVICKIRMFWNGKNASQLFALLITFKRNFPHCGK